MFPLYTAFLQECGSHDTDAPHNKYNIRGTCEWNALPPRALRAIGVVFKGPEWWKIAEILERPRGSALPPVQQGRIETEGRAEAPRGY